MPSDNANDSREQPPAGLLWNHDDRLQAKVENPSPRLSLLGPSPQRHARLADHPPSHKSKH